jgi:RimJ/RimL family protein N-acetyltransferase
MTFHITPMIFPTLETERLVLRELTVADAEHVFRFFSDPEVMQFYDCEPLTSIEEAKMLIRRFCQWFANQNGFRWGIALKSEPHLIIGTCGLFSWHRPNRTATLGYELSRPYWRRGIMTEALRALLGYGFGQLELNRIRATVVTANGASANLLEKLSFQKEGLLREAQFVNGKFDDLFSYALLRKDWAA